MRIVVIIQARTASTRLPGKVLLPLRDRPLLQRMVERVAASSFPLDLVIATTVGSEDDPIRRLSRWMGLPCYSGHPTDLLERHYQAARMRKADMVVKIPSDCPLIDPSVIDSVLRTFLASPGTWDYGSNLHPASHPDGNDVEIVPIEILARAREEAVAPHEREHTTPFVWDRPARFRLLNVRWETGLDYSMSHRFTVDYPEDYRFVSSVYNELWSPSSSPFDLIDILKLLRARPDIYAHNARYRGVNWYRHHLGNLQTVGPGDTRRPEGE